MEAELVGDTNVSAQGDVGSALSRLGGMVLTYKKNIRYRSKEIQGYYSQNRNKWDDLYASEQWVFRHVVAQRGALGDVLDVGCACAGLALALDKRKLGMSSYHGIDINDESVGWTRTHLKLSIPVVLTPGDILSADIQNCYDSVISLSCADWNIETKQIIDKCWSCVREGGDLIISLRLTCGESINDIKRSYQFIEFSDGGTGNAEIANYVVFNAKECLKMFSCMSPNPSRIGAYGYWGKPSSTARTPYNKLVFAVFFIQKPKYNNWECTVSELYLPVDILL